MDDEWYMEQIEKVDEFMQKDNENGVPDEIRQAYYHGVRGWLSVLSARLQLQTTKNGQDSKNEFNKDRQSNRCEKHGVKYDVCSYCRDESVQYLTLTEEQITRGYELVRQTRKVLKEYEYSDTPEMAAGILRDVPLMKEAGLLDMAIMLEKGEYGCHKNDVLGLIEHIEQLIVGNWPKQKEDR